MPQVKRDERVDSLRSWFGLTQEAFGRVLGVSKRAVIRWEAGEVEPSLPVVRSLRLLQEIKKRVQEKYPEDPRAWLSKPHRALLGRTPLDVLVDAGPVPVRDLLVRREAGGYR